MKRKYIKTPKKMWDLFCAYREEVKANPIKIVEQRKGPIVLPKGFDGEMPESTVQLPAQRPLTMEGFENYCADLGVINDLGDYFSDKDGRYSGYATICSRIKKTIRQDQIEGGMAGIYNPSITQRLNGLTDKSHVEVDGKQTYNVTLNIGA